MHSLSKTLAFSLQNPSFLYKLFRKKMFTSIKLLQLVTMQFSHFPLPRQVYHYLIDLGLLVSPQLVFLCYLTLYKPVSSLHIMPASANEFNLGFFFYTHYKLPLLHFVTSQTILFWRDGLQPPMFHPFFSPIITSAPQLFPDYVGKSLSLEHTV